MSRVRTNYKVRVLFDDFKEKIVDGLTYQEALDKFRFYIDCVLQFSMNDVRCVNLMNGKGTIKMFENH